MLELSRLYWRRAGPYWAYAAEMELMEMSCRRPREAWSVPALAPAVAGEQVARPVKPCNAPATTFSVGRGHRSFTAEVAFCPMDGDSLKVAPSVLMMTSPSASRHSRMKCNPGRSRFFRCNHRATMALKFSQLGWFGVSIHIEIIWQKVKLLAKTTSYPDVFSMA
jgi:hypothetical protein